MRQINEPTPTVQRRAAVKLLWRGRQRSRFVLWSNLGLLALGLVAWFGGPLEMGPQVQEQRDENVARFLAELRPYPLQDATWDWQVAGQWARDLLQTRGLAAAGQTLAVSIVAIALAGLLGAALSLPAARNLASPAPFLPRPRRVAPALRAGWGLLVLLSRSLLVVLRSIPEYVWAYLLLALLGPTAWPMVLALGLHNAGILGKLNAELIENLEQPRLSALRALGATRAQIVLAGIFPLSVPRFLLYYFYRWETCVREATVLGMLGMASLGFWIVDARARNHYDEMIFYIMLGVVLVLVGDAVSAVARALVRRA